MLISVVIPAHNRPELLREAVQSIASQPYGSVEVVVVDDGSVPPIEFAPLDQILGRPITARRHDVAQGIAAAKNVGVRGATGEVILVLDDDDLLLPNALQTIADFYANHPEIDCLFMGVEPFGPYADGPARKRRETLDGLLARTRPESRDGLYFFDDRLFRELIGRVPIDFQRPAARRTAWNRVSGFDEGALFSEPAWAIKAAADCCVALSQQPLTRWRIHDSNFGWPSERTARDIAARNVDNDLHMAMGLYRSFELKSRRLSDEMKALRQHLASAHLAKAQNMRAAGLLAGWRHVFAGLRLAPSWRALRAAVAYVWPGASTALSRMVRRR